jgi:hypothetical protein
MTAPASACFRLRPARDEHSEPQSSGQHARVRMCFSALQPRFFLLLRAPCHFSGACSRQARLRASRIGAQRSLHREDGQALPPAMQPPAHRLVIALAYLPQPRIPIKPICVAITGTGPSEGLIRALCDVLV